MTVHCLDCGKPLSNPRSLRCQECYFAHRFPTYFPPHKRGLSARAGVKPRACVHHFLIDADGLGVCRKPGCPERRQHKLYWDGSQKIKESRCH